MNKYDCEILNQDGTVSRAVREASSREEVISFYTGTGNYVLSARALRRSRLGTRKARLGDRDLLSFTEIMATLIRSGLSVQHALVVFQGLAARPAASHLAKSVLDALRSGDSLHTALSRYDSVFSPLYLSMIRIGEKTGSVDGVLKILSDYLRLLQSIRGKIRNALIYPVLVLVLAVAGSFAIAFFVAPRMAEILSVFRPDASGLRGSDSVPRLSALRGLLLSSVAVCALSVAALPARRLSSGFAEFLDGLALRLPGIGMVLAHFETLNFSFAMEMLVSSGFSLPEALRESAVCVGNRAYRKALARILVSLERGERLSDSFLREKSLPAHIGMWLAVAEETGNVSASFSHIRSFFQAGLEDATGRIVSTIEPAAILVVGIIVMILVIQFVVPVFAMYGKVL